MPTPQDVIQIIASGQNLSKEQAAQAMEGIMNGDWSPSQIGAYITALSIKGESQEEIVGSASVMRAKAVQKEVSHRPLLDPVGSGGDGAHTINVSTLAGLVGAGAGVTIAKHGNRAMTGQCGAADFLEALGVDLDISAEAAVEGIDEVGFAFLFAQKFHPSMRHAAGPRKEVGLPSMFNYLGPLTNPLQPEYHLVGVNKQENTKRFTEVLIELGCKHSMVVHGGDGMDEITLSAETHVVEQFDGKVNSYIINPGDFGFDQVPKGSLALSSRDEAIRMGREVLEGKAPESHTNLVLLNAGAVVYLGGKAPSLKEGIVVARESLSSGAAREVAEKAAAYTQSRKNG